MKLKLAAVVLLGVITVSPLKATEPAGGFNWPVPPDKQKISYALGMQAGLQSKQASGDLDPGVFGQAVKDVMEEKALQIDETEMAKILNQGRTDGGLLKQAAIDKEKVSYALGMRMAKELKRDGAELDINAVTQGAKDVVEGKPTQIQESEIESLFKQAEAYSKAKLAFKNKQTGETFLTKNANEPGITVLPDGLQYRVLTTGTGGIPTTNDLVFVKYRGTFIDGKEFDHHDRFLTKSDGGIKGWQDALQRMKIGSKWQIFVPGELAFGNRGENFHHIGPDTTVVYELELLSIATGNDLQVSSGVGHGLDVGNSKPTSDK